MTTQQQPPQSQTPEQQAQEPAPFSTPYSTPSSPFPQASLQRRVQDPTTKRFLVVAALAVVLLLPLLMVGNLVSERASLYRSVVRDISAAWGGEQHLAGPFLVIPVLVRVTSEKMAAPGNRNKEVFTEPILVQKYLVVLPGKADMSLTLDPQSRQRGIYQSLVYTSTLDMQGDFTLPFPEDIDRAITGVDSIDYSKAFVAVGLEYPRALREVGAFIWNGQPLKVEPGVQPLTFLKAGYHIPITLTPTTKIWTFSQKLTFNGSGGLRITPIGESTHIAMTSPWPHPSFQGAVLPLRHEVTEKGFSAEWSVPSLARSFPNLGEEGAFHTLLSTFSLGVDLYAPGAHYKLVERAVKYGILFIMLTFVTLVIFELGLSTPLHPVQYALVGLSMVVFYLVLLSLTEHVSFGWSYTAAAACITGMISLYVGAALRNKRRGVGVGLLLVGLYALLYAILQMEDYALLMGTALVLGMLAVLMVVSRNLNRGGKDL